MVFSDVVETFWGIVKFNVEVETFNSSEFPPLSDDRLIVIEIKIAAPNATIIKIINFKTLSVIITQNFKPGQFVTGQKVKHRSAAGWNIAEFINNIIFL